MERKYIRVCEDPELEFIKTVHSGGATINLYIKRVSEEEKEKNRKAIEDYFKSIGYIAQVPRLNL